MIFSQYSVLSLRSIFFFIDQQHQYFVSVLQPMQDVQYFPGREQGIQEKNHIFTSLYSY